MALNMKKLLATMLTFALTVMILGCTMTTSIKAESIFPATFSEVFPDENLATAISSLLGKNTDDTVVQSDLTTNFRLYNLDISDLDIASLEGIQYINVRQLTARNNRITDLSCLDGITNLTQIVLDNNPLTSVSSLGELPNLQRISLVDTLLTDIDFTNTYTRMQTIDVSGTNIQSLSSSSALPQLRDIYLRNTPFEDLDTLNYLASTLRIIDVSYTAVTDFAPLSNFPEIANFTASGNPDADFDTLPYMSTMALLGFNDNQLTDLDFLSSYSSIPTLFLNDNAIDSSEALAGIQIGFLYLNGNGIVDPSWLSGLTNVLNLYLNRNHILDLTFLDSLPDLRSAVIREQSIARESIDLITDSYQLIPPMILLPVFGPVIYESDAVYNEEGNTLAWSNIQSGSVLSYQWETNFLQYTGVSRLLYYGGEFTQPIGEVGYQITYMNEETISHVAANINDGSVLPVPPTPEKENHRFAGWYQDAAFETIWNFDTDMVYDHMTLYAFFIPIEYHTITFDSMGGTSVEALTVENGQRINRPTDATRTGYTFQGWYTTLAFDQLWNFETDLADEDITLYAQWQVVSDPEQTTPFPAAGVSNVSSWPFAAMMVLLGGSILKIRTKKNRR